MEPVGADDIAGKPRRVRNGNERINFGELASAARRSTNFSVSVFQTSAFQMVTIFKPFATSVPITLLSHATASFRKIW